MTTTVPTRTRTVPGVTRPLAAWALLAGTLVLGATASFGGGSLLLDPTGARMAMSLSWLDGTPFADYFLPGLVLFAVLGLGAFVAFTGLLTLRWWALPATLALATALAGWIGVQVALVGYASVLQPAYALLALVLFVLALAPSTRRYHDADAALKRVNELVGAR